MIDPTAKRAIEKYGKQAQTTQAMQELAELIVALTKGGISNIAEEVVDVEIMLEQVKYMYGVEGLDVIREAKLKRLDYRMRHIVD